MRTEKFGASGADASGQSDTFQEITATRSCTDWDH